MRWKGSEGRTKRVCNRTKKNRELHNKKRLEKKKGEEGRKGFLGKKWESRSNLKKGEERIQDNASFMTDQGLKVER